MRGIRPNHRSAAPSLFVALDTETLPNRSDQFPAITTNLLRFGKACRFRLVAGEVTRQEWLTFTDPAELWEWVRNGLDARKRTWLFCHNAGFDLTASQLWRQLESCAFRPVYRRREAPADDDQADDHDPWKGLLCIDDPPTILDLEDTSSRKCTFVDLMNYFPTSLQKIGESVGLSKLPFPGDEATQEYWEQYCTRDVEIVVAAIAKLVEFIRTNELGNLRYTMSSQSVALYRHRCLTTPIIWEHADDVKVMEREAYYSGRCRAYFVGTCYPRGQEAFRENHDGKPREPTICAGPVARLDVNSHYPAVMRDNAFPVCFRHSRSRPDVGWLARQLRAEEGCAEVRIHSRDEPYPLRSQGRTRWVVGTFRTTLCGPELRRALDAGHVECVYRAQLYQRGYPFRAFVDAVIELRQRAREQENPLLANASKTLGNALHGKFAQWSGGWETDRQTLPPCAWGAFNAGDADTGRRITYRCIGGWVQRKIPKREKSQNFPLISAYTTAYAREHMRALKAVAGPGEVFYEDVDSLHVGISGLARLIKAGWVDPTAPGRLKHEKSATVASWRGPKHYRFDDVWTVAGVNPAAEIDPKGYLHQVDFHRLVCMLNGQPPPGPLTRDTVKAYPVPTLDGAVGPDGWLAYPVEGL